MSFARYAPFATFVALAFLAGVPVAATPASVVSFDVPVVATDPCTGEVGTGTLEVEVVVNASSTSQGGVHVTAHANVHGELTGSRGSVYHVSAEGTSQSSALADVYEIDFHGNAAGDGTAPNLQVDGVAEIRVNAAGTPTGVRIISLSASCGW